jgi:tetratricopeptide (TPR) repeat protein
MDLQRYLADEPVQACPPSAWYRFRKFSRRNKSALVVASLILFFVLSLGGVAGWFVRERASRQTVLENEITAALQVVEDSYQHDKIPESLAALTRAEGLLASGECRQAILRRVRQWRDDLDLVTRFEEIRLERYAFKEGHLGDSSDSGCREMFQRYGLDMEVVDPTAAVENIQASPIKEHLVIALDYWAVTKIMYGRPGGERLIAIARRADTNHWRNEFRDCIRFKDGKATINKALLEELARHHGAEAPPRPSMWLLGSLLTESGNLSLSVDVLRQAQQRYPEDFWINWSLAEGMRRMNPSRLDEALGFARAALAVHPRNPFAHVQLGMILWRQGKLDEAVGQLNKAIDLQPDYARAHNWLAELLIKQGKTLEALAACRKAIELKPDEAESHVTLGLLWEKQGLWDDAMAEAREALRLKADLAVAHYNLGIYLANLGHRAEAIKEYREAIRLDPTDPNAHNNLGIQLIDNGEPDKAISELHEAIRLRPDEAKSHHNLGNALQAKGELDRAISCFQEAMRLDPNDPEPHNSIGCVLSAQGKDQQALAEWNKALELRPDLAAAHSHIGNVLVRQGRLDDAIREHRRAIELYGKAPGDRVGLSGAHNGLGDALGRQGKLDDAVAQFRMAIKLNPDDGGIHFNLAVFLAKQGKVEESLRELRKEIEAKRPFLGASGELAAFLVICPDTKLRDPRLALEMAMKGIKLDSRSALYWQILGWAHYRTGNPEDSVKALEKSIQFQDGKGDAGQWLFLAMAHWQLGHRDVARTWYDKAQKSDKKDWPEEFHRFLAEAAKLTEIRAEKKD